MTNYTFSDKNNATGTVPDAPIFPESPPANRPATDGEIPATASSAAVNGLFPATDAAAASVCATGTPESSHFSKKGAKIAYRSEKRRLRRRYKTQKRDLKDDFRGKKRQAKAEYREETRFVSARKKQEKLAARTAEFAEKEQTHAQKQELSAPLIEEKRRQKAAKAERRQEKREAVRKVNAPPVLTPLEEIGNAVTHGVGAVCSVAATVLMLVRSHTAAEIIAALTYGLSLTFLFLMSCLYHAFKKGSTVKRVWRRFDYSSIYLLIGGTFAPLFLVDLGGKLGTVCFILQWVLIATGITFVGVFGPGRLRWLHFPLYFVLGWSGLMLVPHWLSTCPALFWWILAGGLAYSFGMIPFVLRGKRAAHFVWHFFVLVGAALQWIGIYAHVFCG